VIQKDAYENLLEKKDILISVLNYMYKDALLIISDMNVE